MAGRQRKARDCLSDQPRIAHARNPARREKTPARTSAPVTTIVTARKPGSRRLAPLETVDAVVEAAVRA